MKNKFLSLVCVSWFLAIVLPLAFTVPVYRVVTARNEVSMAEMEAIRLKRGWPAHPQTQNSSELSVLFFQIGLAVFPLVVLALFATRAYRRNPVDRKEYSKLCWSQGFLTVGFLLAWGYYIQAGLYPSGPGVNMGPGLLLLSSPGLLLVVAFFGYSIPRKK